MNIDVCLTPSALAEDSAKGKIVVVIDVLRACSTIVTALANGAREVLPVADVGEAGRFSAHLDAETAVLGGERGGLPIEGYGAGNSPREYVPKLVARKIVVLSTSNGTKAFTQVRQAAETVAGCFLNMSRVVDFLSEVSERPYISGEEPQVLILCAGSDGRTALEDVLAAGMVLDRLLTVTDPSLSDSARIALTQYGSVRKSLASSLLNCTHAQRLIGLGFGDDIAYSARVDALPILPRYKDNLLALDRDDKQRARVLTDNTQDGESAYAELAAA